jgi:amidohydrolase
LNMQSLKDAVCAEIDRRAGEITEIGGYIMKNPELGYRENNTSRYVRDLFDSEGLPYQAPFGITGVRACLQGGDAADINVAVLSELDAVVCYEHPYAERSNGSAHACGHNAQIASMFGVLYGLKKIINRLDGKVTFFAVPAEEYIESDYRSSLIGRGIIKYKGGKQQLIHEGAFDGIDMAMMVHSAAGCPEPELFDGGTSLGFVAENITIHGREAHASAPHQGINALNAAALAICAINANRETFRDCDSVRVHPIITKGGDIVNVVPSEVCLEMMIRGATVDAIKDACMKVNRSFEGAALAIGACAGITETPGYLPLCQDETMTRLFEQNALRFITEDKIHRKSDMTGSTDIGDLSALIPVIQPSMGGFSGNAHSRDFTVADENAAYILPAKIMAMTVVDLLYGGAEIAKKIKEEYKPRMTKAEYLAYLEN